MKFLILLLSIVCVSIAQGQIATISGQIENFKDDTIKLVLQLNNITRRSEIHAIPVNNGRFSDAMQLTKPTYFYLTDGSNYINGLIEPGDRVAILYDAANIKTSLKAKGNGSEKTDFVNSLLQLKLYRRLVEQVPVARTNKYPFDYLFNYCDSIGNTLFRKLDSIKPFMKTESYDLLRTDVKATVMGNRY